MTVGLKPYPSYKESGVAWLGKVPEHWQVLPNRALFRGMNERNHPDERMLSVTITQGVIPQRSLLEGTSKKDASNHDKSAYKLVCPGDISYNKMRAWQGAIGASEFRGIVSPAYVVIRLRGENNQYYFHYLFRTPAFAKEAERWSYGITSDMWSLRPEHFRMIYSTCPPEPEQAAIVRYLDHIDRLTRCYIQAKQKLIKLLNEQKQAIIRQALTRGLDQNIRLRRSGVEWLGEVPEYWKIQRFKLVTHITSGQVDPRTDKYADYPLVAPNHIEIGTGRLLKVETARQQGADSGKYFVRKGQIIYSKIRPNLRKATIAPFDCLCSADMYPITPNQDEINVEFLLALMLSQPFTKYVVDASMRVAMPKVNRDALGDCVLWYPSLREQETIVRWLSEVIAPVDTAIDREERKIVLIREYRARLIAEVVTGKIDVREVAEKLPEDIVNEEPIEEPEADMQDESEEALDTESEAEMEEAPS